MAEIQTFPFDKTVSEKLRKYKFGFNWPTVYLLENGKEIYIGQTTSAFARSKAHLDNQNRARLKRMHVISDDEFNLSANMDMESWLIQYISAEGTLKLQNGNAGLRNHDYFDRDKYRAKFELTWETLKKMSLVKQDLIQLRNTDVFKFSPYKALSEDQLLVVRELFRKIKEQKQCTYVISGKPGTGKTVLASYLMKYLSEHPETTHLKVGLVVPMVALRKTLKKVFKRISGLSPDQVIGPADVIKDRYDLLVVDEAHRLKRRVNIPNYGSFDRVNRTLGYGNEGTELDWILKSSSQQIFFYDPNQSVRPSDVSADKISELKAERYALASQLRVEGGDEYIQYVDNLLNLEPVTYTPAGYDFRIYDDVKQMVDDIKEKDSAHGLSRVVAGYAWRWVTRTGKGKYDIEIDGLRLVWNSTLNDWVNSKNAINEVGCIHTVQGYDLNYAGVIIGPEIYYDPASRRIKVNPRKYMDINGRRSVDDPKELERYVINIYKTLLTRGIKGTYVYISDEKLRRLFKESLIAEKTFDTNPAIS
jgi:uncharacterized protein